MIQGYGTGIAGDPNSCFLLVNPKALLPYKKDYKVSIACFVYDGTMNVLDAPNLQVGNLYDINEADSAYLKEVWGDSFNEYRKQHGTSATWIALLVVPNGVQTSQFTTLRQARSFGARIPAVQIKD